MSASLDEVYVALRAADAAGNTADAQRLADYIRDQSGESPPAAPLKPPVPTAPVGNFWQNFARGVGMGAEKFGAGMGQRAVGLANPETGETLPEALPATKAEAERVRQYYEPLSHTWGGNIGEAALYSLPAMIPGVNTVAGAGALGAVVGAGQPTIWNEDWRTNALISSLLAMGGQKLGSMIGNWATGRASQPWMGYDIDKAAARAVGSDADRLIANPTENTIGPAHDALQAIYKQARSPDVQVPMESLSQSESALLKIEGSLQNESSLKEFAAHRAVKDFYGALTGSPTEAPTMEQLGSIASRLRKSGSQIMAQEAPNWELGNAYKSLSNHIDQVIQDNIADPALQQAYATVRPKYALLEDLRWNPSLLNTASGKANGPAIGRFMQRNVSDYSLWGPMMDASPLGRAANFAQATGELKAPEGLKAQLMDALLHNTGTRALGGALSRGIAPITPAAGALGQAGAYQALPLINALRGVPASQWIPPALSGAAAPQ